MYYQTRPKLGDLFDKLRIDEEGDNFIVNFEDGQYDDIDSWHIHHAANKYWSGSKTAVAIIILPFRNLREDFSKTSPTRRTRISLYR
jgi:hypothetical protein